MLVLLSNDTIRPALGIPYERRGHTPYVYEALSKLAANAIDGGRSVVLDATFYRSDYRAVVWHMLETRDVQLAIMQLCTRASVCRNRVRHRAGGPPARGMQDLARFERVADAATRISPTEVPLSALFVDLDCTQDAPLQVRQYTHGSARQFHTRSHC
jgi:predicted kinase